MPKYVFADAGLIDVVTLPEVVGTDVAQAVGGFVAPKDIKITAVYLVPDANITGRDTNTFKVTLRNYGKNGAGTASVASVTFTSGVNATAKVPLSLTLSDVSVSQGEVIGEDLTIIGTGLAYPDHRLTIVYKYQ